MPHRIRQAPVLRRERVREIIAEVQDVRWQADRANEARAVRLPWLLPEWTEGGKLIWPDDGPIILSRQVQPILCARHLEDRHGDGAVGIGGRVQFLSPRPNPKGRTRTEGVDLHFAELNRPEQCRAVGGIEVRVTKRPGDRLCPCSAAASQPADGQEQGRYVGQGSLKSNPCFHKVCLHLRFFTSGSGTTRLCRRAPSREENGFCGRNLSTIFTQPSSLRVSRTRITNGSRRCRISQHASPFGGRKLPPFGNVEAIHFECADLHAHQAQRGVADGCRHATHLAVLALDQF